MMNNNNANRRQFPAAFGGRGRPMGAPRPYRAHPPKETPVKKEEKIDLNSEMNFPSLGRSDSSWTTPIAALPGSIAAAGAGTSFASLATGWQASDDAEQERVEMEKMAAERSAVEYNRFATIRRFATNSHCHVTSSRLFRYGEDEDEEAEPTEHEAQQERRRVAESEWTTVDRKAKKGFQPQFADYSEEAEEEDYDY